MAERRNALINRDVPAGSFTELNDLSSTVTWANVPDANITESSVTQHEAALDHDALTNFVAAEHLLVGAIDHDSLLNFLAAEHVDWAGAGAGTIHTDNYVENATHTGHVTGDGALTLVVAAITGQTALTSGLADTDELLVSDAGVIKRMDLSVLATYIGSSSEVNDLSSIVTWTNVPDANITVGSVTQHVASIDHDSLLNFVAAEHLLVGAIDHDSLLNFVAAEHLLVGAIDHDLLLNFAANEHFTEASISITETQISDLGSYLLNIVEDTTPQLGGNLDMNSKTIAGIAEANFLDKVAAETVSGVWSFTQRIQVLKSGGGTNSMLWLRDSTDNTNLDFFYNGTDFEIRDTSGGAGARFMVFDDSTRNVSFDQAVDVGGALTATSFGGITSANLVDKTADETISGQWFHSGRFITDDSTTTRSGFQIQVGVAPTSPEDGDMWITTSDILARVNGVSESLLGISAEVNDLSSVVTWANVPDANITEGSVTQHEAALTILESQITNANVLARITGTESITGVWSFTQRIQVLQSGGGAASFIWLRDSTDGTNLDFFYNGTDFEIRDTSGGGGARFMVFDASTRNVAFDQAVDVGGALTAVSFGGITSGDLVDKTFNETISGQWFHSGRLITDDSTTTRSGFKLQIGVAPTTPEDGDMWVTTNDALIRIGGASKSLIADTVYTHPAHPGDDFSVDSALLSGATVISDIDINVTTDTQGHVTDANGTIATRELTAANIGASATGHTHTGSTISALDTADTTTGTFANARISESSVTQHEGAIDHDKLSNFLATEHVNWAAGGAGTIHTDNYVENYNHTGHVLGATSLSVVVAAITGQTALTSGLADTDEMLISDGGVIKRMDFSVLKTYIGSSSEVNDLSSIVTWANIPIGNVPTGSTGTTVSLGDHKHDNITDTNLLDKAATEIVSGVWGFSQRIQVIMSGGGTNSMLWLRDSTDNTNLDFFYNGVDFEIRDTSGGAGARFMTFDNSTRNVAFDQAVDVGGALTAVSFGGITSGNLVDKTFNETITGEWFFSGKMTTRSSQTGSAGFALLAAGVAPTSPVDGDMWITTTDALVRVGGSTKSMIVSHPTHPGDDFSIDSGALTGATVISDIDINVTTDTLGHVTDANAAIATRVLSINDLGGPYNNYTHPAHPGDDMAIDSGALINATVISDIDLNVTTDAQGHVTDANATIATRNLTAANVGALATGGTAANSSLLLGIGMSSTGDSPPGADKVVRTQTNGYTYVGWLNTVSGATTNDPVRIFASNDQFLRYMTPTNFINFLEGEAWDFTVTPKIGAANIATVNTNWSAADITSGTLAAARGGTAQTTYVKGDILYASATNTLAKLPIGATDEVLTVASGLPSWATGGGGGGGTIQYAFKLVTTTKNNNTFANDPELTMSIVAGFWKYEIWVRVLCASVTPDIKTRMAEPAHTWDLMKIHAIQSGSTLVRSVADARTSIFTSLSANIPAVIHMTGTIKATATGTFAVQWAQNTTNATVTQVTAGSYMILTKLD